MDISKPEGDACDGTLKDASEMEWPDSPTEHNHALITQHEDDWQFQNDGSELEFPDSPSEYNSISELGNKKENTSTWCRTDPNLNGPNGLNLTKHRKQRSDI